MATATMEDVRIWQGRTVVDSQGEKIGTIEDVYFDKENGKPEWALVNTGLFGLKHNFIPISQELQQTSGGKITVSWTKDQVKDAPKVDSNQELSQEEERKLYDYYGIDWQQSESGSIYPNEQGTQQAPPAQATGMQSEQMQSGRTSGYESTRQPVSPEQYQREALEGQRRWRQRPPSELARLSRMGTHQPSDYQQSRTQPSGMSESDLETEGTGLGAGGGIASEDERSNW